MKVALLLHFYQPALQEESVLRQVSTQCYLPLVKLIKANKNHKFTLNIPLSLLELMDKYGYAEWIADIKNLYENERIELTGCSAYHALLPKLPESIMEEEVALNEYGLGYYLGSRHGFEGDPSIMIKDVKGFFPPELAVNEAVTSVLNSFGYDWLLTEETVLDKELWGSSCIYELGEKGIKLVIRDRVLSNMLSFKRDTSVDDIMSYIRHNGTETNPLVIALDAELFGHHYSDGIFLLDALLSELERAQISLVSISEVVNDFECLRVSTINESSWGSSREEYLKGDIYPFWIDNNNEIQCKLWNIQEDVVRSYLQKVNISASDGDYNSPIWKFEESTNLVDKTKIECIKYILFHKFLSSDKFWWASRKEIMGKVLWDLPFIAKYIGLIDSIYQNSVPTDLEKAIKEVKALLI